MKDGRDSTMSELMQALERMSQHADVEWKSSLNARKRAEADFHDKVRTVDRPEGPAGMANDTFEELYSNRKFYSTVAMSREYVDKWIAEHARGKVFLDYACGNGQYARLAARSGAAMSVGIDISPVSVENCRRAAAAEGLTKNCRFVQGDCENTGLPDASVDAVICCGVLHHLDLSYVFPELRRILRPGGAVLALEALDYNPVIKLYRNVTPNLRTEWEKAHILSLKDVRFASRFFDVRSVKYWHLFSILTTPLRRTPIFQKSLDVANMLDSLFLKVPPLNRLAWTFTFELVRPQEWKPSSST